MAATANLVIKSMSASQNDRTARAAPDAARFALIAAGTAAASAAFLLAAGSNRFALACVLPFAFVAALVPVFASGLCRSKSIPAAEANPDEKSGIAGLRARSLLDAAAIPAGLAVGTMAAAASIPALVSLLLATSFAVLIAGIAALLSLVIQSAIAAAAASVLAFAGLASPFLIGPLLTHSGSALRSVLLALAYWANPMAVATHAGLGFDFFRIRGGPVMIYGTGVSEYMYAYPAWWAVALLHAVLGGVALAIALRLSARRFRPKEAGRAA